MTYKRALQAYQRAQHSVMRPRFMEQEAFAQAISMLRIAQEDITAFRDYAEAVKFNQRLWTFIQSSLTDNGDSIPVGIRSNLLNLSIFIDRCTISALTTPNAAKLDALIDININISRGLMSATTDPAILADNQLPSHGFLPN